MRAPVISASLSKAWSLGIRWRNRRPTHTGIQAVELARHVAQHVIDQRANGPERMLFRHPRLGRHITEHRFGAAILSSHARHRST